ncbi:hypothetical protein J3E72DRAFT_377558 [Bipolaris maydis]|uniref:uncharacterized protein n=1 Tax=Cochliobolus heterostrophus TaxID=5016 RepID=UPI0024D0A022|nr:hypothetical protein BM1_10561 [Bipolaris maydis]KAJ5024460.1 hypothetical protein J3E73DRAFT_259458 [Bipolaris maydis]KAJ5057872.1 hypothetical protein J3E74DRAFT_293133 [Bipolaris maydis]KAJ6195121.1 hypothetical protein J3E72DRAFT_377558 [Bipolaris maydis]KAJ6268314.1 hypothetical protein PSV08DRAFT_353968 [Bipolaris maydis]
MANGWAPIIGLIVVVIFCAAAWVLAPKGENQTYVYRTIPSSKTASTPSKPCLRTKVSSQHLGAAAAVDDQNENERKLRGSTPGTKRVHFAYDGETCAAYTAATADEKTT